MPAIDAFVDVDLTPNQIGGMESPARHSEDVTPHDTNELTNVSRALYVGADADVTVVMVGGETCLFKSVKAGTILPIRVKIVKSTGTTPSAYIRSLW